MGHEGGVAGGTVARLGNDVDVARLFEQAPVAGAHHRVVIDQNDADHAASLNAQSTDRCVAADAVAGGPSGSDSGMRSAIVSP